MRENRTVSNEPDPAASTETVDVSIRRAPKVWVFLALGLIVGILAALVLTSVFEVDPTVGFTGTFAYLALYSVPASIALFAIVALVLDRVSRGRARTASAVHEVAHDEAPSTE
ncbi:MAG TPA: potassium transporter Trk [Terrimesophilobacter sp.]|nr:potassium transporter Trk [Terrimesophilobacter sp.]